jgi:DnaJ family protein C protein 3
MRLLALQSLLLLLLSYRNSCFVAAAADGGLYPPGLLPLINKANVLLSSGQFNEAAKVYSEAIGGVFRVCCSTPNSRCVSKF